MQHAILLQLLIPLPLLLAARPAEFSGKDRHLTVVRRYADAMLERGRDAYGSVRSPLFASALDREKLTLPDQEPPAPEGVRSGDRTLSGANLMHDENLLRLLYALTPATGDRRYEAAADEALRFFLGQCQSEATGLFAWGEHLGWDFRTEAPLDGRDQHEYYRPWVLWEKSYGFAPEACAKFALGVWEHQIADRATGNFNRHAKFKRHGPGRDAEYPRHAGFYISTWGSAYARTKDAALLTAIETLVDSFERRREPNGRFPSGSPRSDLSWAIDVWDTAALVPEPLAQRMRGAAKKTDEYHMRKFKKGFSTDPEKLWITAYGDATTAMEAMICHERLRQIESQAMRDLVLGAAQAYLASEPPKDATLYPGAFGEVIALMLTAHRLTKDDRFRARAEGLADSAVTIFWNDESPLPRASTKHTHYEAITRADTLALALLELWSVLNRPEKPLAFTFIDR